MSPSTIALALFVFLQGAAYLGWFNVSATFFGVVAIAYVVLLLLEVFGVLHVNLPVNRHRTTE